MTQGFEDITRITGVTGMPRPQVLSIAERLDVDLDARGRGVTMAFVDMGFHPHADLMRPSRRILAYVDATRDAPVLDEFLTPNLWAWHGTMTSCAAAGGGYLSGGRYRGLASEAAVVLIQCSDDTHLLLARHVAHAIRVPLRHPELRISVMNVSVGVDPSDPGADDVLAAVREVTEAGVTVFAAAGNREGATPEPPASAREAITVGGWNDGNTSDPSDDERFPSSAGKGKPDLLAPAAWLPAPMVPGTPESREAAVIFELVSVLQGHLDRAEFKPRTSGLSDSDRASIEATLAAVTARVGHQKFITPDYQHVDGTSFASPITASVAAQMLEVDPSLTPALIREGLLSTARRVPGLSPAKQGAGVLHPRAAVLWARARAAANRKT